MRVDMLAEFDEDEAATHFVRDCAGRAGTREGVENEIAGLSSKLKDSVNQLLRFRSYKNFNVQS